MPTWLLSAPIGSVAAITCGTAYTVSPAKVPYCVCDSPSTGTSTGNPSTTSTPNTAVNAMDDATSSPSAPITGATAAIAELPQIELPHATSTAIRCGNPSDRQIP